jgi:hypothetical protein
MAFINENYLKLKAGYLFPEIGRRVREFAAANPGKDIIRMGIGDVTKAPLKVMDLNKVTIFYAKPLQKMITTYAE